MSSERNRTRLLYSTEQFYDVLPWSWLLPRGVWLALSPASMDKQGVKTMLDELGFTAGLPQPLVEQLAEIGAVVDFPAGTTIFQEGTKNPFLYVVSRGHVGLDMYVPGRGRVRVLSVGPGEMLAWSALLGDGMMTVSAVALEDTHAIAFSGPQLVEVCGANHEVGYRLMYRMAKALAQRLVATRLQLLDLFAEPLAPAPIRS